MGYQGANDWTAQKVNDHKDGAADAKAAKAGASADPTLVAAKAELRALLPAVTAVVDAYKPLINKSSDLLHLPSLAMWTTELGFLGGEDAIKPIHDLAAHVEELSLATVRARTVVLKRYVDDMSECKASLRAGVDAVNAYLQAEVSLKDKAARLEQQKATAAGVPAPPAPPVAESNAGAEGDGEDGKEEPDAAGEVEAGRVPPSLPPKTAAKLAKLEAEVAAAAAKMEAAKTAAATVRDEVPSIKGTRLKEAHERLKAGLLEEAVRVAGLLGAPETEAKFAAYKPTSATTCLADGVAKVQRIEIKVDLFGGKDASEKAAQVAEAERRLKAADMYLELAQKQVTAFCKEGVGVSAKTVLAIDGLAAATALAEEEGTRAAIAAARGAAASDAGVANAKKAGNHFVGELGVYRAAIAARLAEARAYHELGKRHTSLAATLKKKEAAGKPGAVMELQTMRAEVEVQAAQLAESFEKFEAEMALMGDAELSVSRLVGQRVIVPFSLFVVALVDVWKAQHEPVDDVEPSTGLDPGSIEWLYPPVPEVSDAAVQDI